MAILLLDTHALLWWLADDSRLPGHCRELISKLDHAALASAATAWEISIKRALGKLQAPDDLLAAVDASGLEWVGIAPQEAVMAGELPLHHRDPFDRLLVAQAKCRGAQLVSGDRVLDAYGVTRIW